MYISKKNAKRKQTIIGIGMPYRNAYLKYAIYL